MTALLAIEVAEYDIVYRVCNNRHATRSICFRVGCDGGKEPQGIDWSGNFFGQPPLANYKVKSEG